MPVPTVAAARLVRRGGALSVRTDAYVLDVLDAGPRFADAPFLHLRSVTGDDWVALTPLTSLDTTATPDETVRIGELQASEADDGVTLSVETESTAWRRHTWTLLCRQESLEVSVTVEGRGRLTDVTLLGGTATLPTGATGAFRSGIGYRSLFVPVPTEPVQAVRAATSGAVLGVLGDADPGRFHGIFSPPPLALGLGREAPPAGATEIPDGEWLGLSVRAPVEDLTFVGVAYEPVDGGFLLRLGYEGHTRVGGAWTSPTIVLRPAASAWAVLDDHRRDLAEHGHVPERSGPQPAWWREPIFCGWGAQCSRAVALLHGAADARAGTTAETQADEERVVTAAPMLASQRVYDEFLAVLEANDLRPGTIVIDDRWQDEYGTATPDTARWPDLAGWIRERHAAGQRVLLWWKAWDPRGLPVDECITDAAGRPVAVDVANPAYLNRLRGIVTTLISSGGLDADGFKVDFTQRSPSGRTLSAAEGTWGIAALHRLLKTITDAAHAAKRDALVVCHTVHPSFGDVADMVRLNDVLKHDMAGRPVPVIDQMRFRHGVVSRTLPGHLVDTDQWPMPNRREWLDYAALQPELGVPALYYLESIDRSGERVEAADLDAVRRTWVAYRSGSGPQP